MEIDMTKIPRFVHECYCSETDRDSSTEVEYWQYETGEECDNCGEPLATTEDLVGHMYLHLSEED